MTPKQYNDLNELLAQHSALSAQLAGIEAKVNLKSLDAVRPLLPEHAETKARIAEIEGKVREMAVAHPELFPDEKKTHQTPFGAISFRTSSYLDIEDAEKTILRIKLACEKELVRSGQHEEPPRFTEQQLIRTHEEPNLEALELLEDAQLAAFGIVRKQEEKFNVKPLEVKADKLAKREKEQKTAAMN